MIAVCLLGWAAASGGARQVRIARIERMPNIPPPLRIRDWRAVARGFDRLAFDLDAKGEHLPLIWPVRDKGRSAPVTFGLPSYVGDYRKGGGGRRLHEAVTCMGAVLGATVAGIDKSRGPCNWVRMCEAYYDPRDAVLRNRTDLRAGGSFWYDLLPHLTFYALADRYPKLESAQKIVRRTADRWLAACKAMTSPDGKCDFNHTAFSFRTMKPVDNGRWTEPDAAGAVAWLEYMAYARWRAPEHLAAARACMDFLQARKTNPFYEVLLPFGAYTAARMNAELGSDYDVAKLVNWCFSRSAVRPDFMVIADRWSGHDCHGLMGAVNRPPRAAGGGYAFTMNTFVTAWPLTPLVRYDARFARAVGKWMLNAANAARLFYPRAHPASRQSCAGWKGDPNNVIAYEGLLHKWRADERLYAGGDPVTHKWGPKTDLGVYGSAYVGIFGGIIARTDDKKILQLDLLATDFFAAKAFPTYLYYNPHAKPATIRLDVGAKPRDLYDCVTGRFIKRNAAGRTGITIPPDGAVVCVLVPVGGKTTRQGRKLLIDGIVADYHAEAK